MYTKPHILFDKTKSSLKILSALEKKNIKKVPIYRANFFLVIGGDGFMLKILKKFYKYKKPFYGVNSGSYGFLMNKFSKNNFLKNMKKIHPISINPLTMSVKNKNNQYKKSIAVNEISILRQSRQAAKIAIKNGNKTIIKKLISDGVLVSSPAGSTAYNLSVHGPILNLDSKKFAITPISPFRPRRWKGTIVSEKSKIVIKNLDHNKRPINAVADNVEVRNAKIIKIQINKKIKFVLLYNKNSTLEKKSRLNKLEKKRINLTEFKQKNLKENLSLIYFVLFFLLFFPSTSKTEILKVFYAGFSFSNTYESNSISAKYTSDLVKEINSETGIDIISSILLKKAKKMHLDNIDLDTENLLDFSKFSDNAIAMSVVLEHEEFTEEINWATKIHSGWYDAYFQILFYDFSDQSLIASIPFDFEIRMLSEEKYNKKIVLDKVRDFYLHDSPFAKLDNKINQFNIKRKYDRRIGITQIDIQDKAFEKMPAEYKKKQNVIKNLIAQSFAERLSSVHNVAIVPYVEGQAIGKAMKLRFVQSDDIYSLKMANPDYQIHINLKGFKKVLAQSSDVEDQYLYGSFIDLKIFQPDLDKIYFDESLRGVTTVKIPKDIEPKDWRKYYYNLKILFENFSLNIKKQDKKWMKKATKNKIKKKLKSLNTLLEKVK